MLTEREGKTSVAHIQLHVDMNGISAHIYNGQEKVRAIVQCPICLPSKQNCQRTLGAYRELKAWQAVPRSDRCPQMTTTEPLEIL